MQITANTTGMPADLTVATDKMGQDYCVVVVKGTFAVDETGEATLAETPEPFVYADAHYGDPGATSIQYECDFAPFKPRCDVLLNGSAYARQGRAVPKVSVGLKAGAWGKTFNVVGDRYWQGAGDDVRPSPPRPFEAMPITYDRAFGGYDNGHPDEAKHVAYMANPVGRGFHKALAEELVENQPLPNTEERDKPVVKPDRAYKPMSFGSVGRGWQPRIGLAGTYDQAWLEEVFPFLPADFDERYFQSAPADQQIDYLLGGETVQAVNMTPERPFAFTVPQVEIPILYRFRDRDELVEPKLDTLIVEPDRSRFLLLWRGRARLGRKLNALREVQVGPAPRAGTRGRSSDTPHFERLSDFIAWKKGFAAGP